MEICENRNTYTLLCRVCPIEIISCAKAEELLREMNENNDDKFEKKESARSYDNNPKGVADY